MKLTLGDQTQDAAPIILTSPAQWPATRQRLSPEQRAYAKAAGFDGAIGSVFLAPAQDGRLECVLFSRADDKNFFSFGKLATLLPSGRYAIAQESLSTKEQQGISLFALSFLLSLYTFGRYKKDALNKARPLPLLETPAGVDRSAIERIAAAIAMGRDLINAPANDMGPIALHKTAEALAQTYGAQCRALIGDALLQENFPLVHAVGQAAAQEPRLVEMRWAGPQARLRLTLIGKGVCFDSGGLDLKPGAAMLLMKKDMAGAATALALAQMIMDAHLPVDLRLLAPIVENSVSATAFRPSDVYPSRKGLSVEIGNTDAEGRLILADALTAASEEENDLIIDFASLTGAARTALGPDLPAYFTENDALAEEIDAAGRAVCDPVWRLPLWEPYDELLESKIADVNNAGGGAFAGAIMAALFLRRFVAARRNWVHFDLYGWTPRAKPGRPEGGEIQTARLLFELLRRRLISHS